VHSDCVFLDMAVSLQKEGQGTREVGCLGQGHTASKD
jgi:hypothetical protein